MIDQAKAAAAVRELRQRGMKVFAVYAGSQRVVVEDRFIVIPVAAHNHLSVGVFPLDIASACRAAAHLGDRGDGNMYVGGNWKSTTRYVEFAGENLGYRQVRVIRLPYTDHFSIGLK